MSALAIDTTASLAIRSNIKELEKTIQAMPESLGKDPFPLNHVFAGGMYAREMKAPADHYIVGKIHKHPHISILCSGTITIVTESGGRETITGPCVMSSPAGQQRAAYTHTDIVWITVNLTNSTDLDEIEKELTVDSHDELALLPGESV